jgi:hypothetical protein
VCSVCVFGISVRTQQLQQLLRKRWCVCVACVTLAYLCARNKAEEEAEARMLGVCLAVPSSSLLVSCACVFVGERVFVGGWVRARVSVTDRQTDRDRNRGRARDCLLLLFWCLLLRCLLVFSSGAACGCNTPNACACVLTRWSVCVGVVVCGCRLAEEQTAIAAAAEAQRQAVEVGAKKKNLARPCKKKNHSSLSQPFTS